MRACTWNAPEPNAQTMPGSSSRHATRREFIARPQGGNGPARAAIQVDLQLAEGRSDDGGDGSAVA